MTNTSEQAMILYYQVDYTLTAVPKNSAYFHAQFRRVNPVPLKEIYTIVDGIKGRGHYVGTYLAWTQLSNGWWGEGEIKFYMDGDTEFPTICGTGTEDYVGGAWCFYPDGMPGGREEIYSTPYMGYPLYRHIDNEIPKHGLYRWHILDPIRFQKDLRVTIQALGWGARDKAPSPLADDIASTAWWYQTEPHAAFPAFPEGTELLTR